MAKMTADMDNKGIKQINDIFRKLDNRELGPALRSVRSLIDTYPHMMYDEELENIEGDYNLMLDYMRRNLILGSALTVFSSVPQYFSIVRA